MIIEIMYYLIFNSIISSLDLSISQSLDDLSSSRYLSLDLSVYRSIEYAMSIVDDVLHIQ